MFWHLFNWRGTKGKRGEDLPAPNEGPPDTARPHGLCPRCEKQSSFEVLGTLPVSFRGVVIDRGRGPGSEYDALDRIASLRCRNCGQGVAVVEEMWVGDKRGTERGATGTVSWKAISWWPSVGGVVLPDVPAPIADSYAEAQRALYAACPRAAVVMARRTLEAVAVDKGEATGTLAERLKRLAAAGVLHTTLADWAAEVRVVGNLGAHFDPLERLSPEDARALVGFARELLRFVYQMPAALRRAREQRQQ